MRAVGDAALDPERPSGLRLRPGQDRGRADLRFFDTTLRVLAAAEEDISPAVMVGRMAEERMASVGRLATLQLQRGW